MRRFSTLLVLVVLFGGRADGVAAQDRTLPPAFEALAPEAQARVVAADTLLRFRTRAVPGGRIDVEEGILRAAYRIGRRMTPAATPDGTARAYLAAEAARFGVSDEADLALRAVVAGRYSTHVTYQQTYYGLPVYNRFVKVNLDRAGQPTMVLNGYAPHLGRVRTFDPRPTWDAAAVQARVQQLVSPGGVRTNTPELVVYPETVPRLAWRVVAWPDGLSAEWEVLLDAHTGEVIRLFDQSTQAHSETEHRSEGAGKHEKASHEATIRLGERPLSSAAPSNIQIVVDGSGLVFDPDPITTAGVEYGAPYVDADDADVGVLNAERIEVTLPDITLGTDGLYRLQGPFVRIDNNNGIGGCSQEGGCPLPPAEADPNAFRYTRADDRFEAVMAYYHVDANQRYVQTLDVGRDIQAVPVRVNPHGLGAADDSKYYPTLNALAFGDGGIDDAEDADVILHEYGHALLQGSAPGLLDGAEGSALHEGWADYWAASYSRGLIETGKVPDRDWRKVFTWDGNEFWPGRVLNRQGHYPDDSGCADGSCSNSEFYTDGLLWATTLMEIYDGVGREVIDRLNLASHGYLSPPTSFADAGEALIQADLDLYGGQHLGVLVARLGERGYVDATGYGPVLAHEPILHVEEAHGDVIIEAEALAVGGPIVSVSFVFSANGGPFEFFALTPQGSERYTGSFPLPSGASHIAYYIEAVDATGLQTLLPAAAPLTTYAFDVGPDAEAPQVAHEPIEQVAIQAWPARIVAEVSDNQGIDSVWVAYTVRQPDGTLDAGGTFGLEQDEARYSGVFPVSVDALHEGSRVQYRLYARDVALAANEALLPTAGAPPFEILIVVEGVLVTFDFERDQALVATGSWARGEPTYGLQVAHSGEFVWATGLDAPYPDAQEHASLDLPPFNLGDLPSSYLVFWHWYDFEHSGVTEPGPAGTGTLWDGANVKASINDGASWTVLEPMDGYDGTMEQGTGNPLQGEPAFGGYSFGWRRAVVPLPQADNVRIRFDVGTDDSNELTSLFYAGWYLDDVRIVTELAPDTEPPAILSTPPALLRVDGGQAPPTLVAVVTDDVGVEAVLAEYEIITAAGSRQAGTQRLAMNLALLTTFAGTIISEIPLNVGDRIEYRIRTRDFDGNTVVRPAEEAAPLRIDYRLAEQVSVLRDVRASGLWERIGRGWAAQATDGAVETVSSLVLEPLDLPDNARAIMFTLSHALLFGDGVGGNLKASLDGGATWSLLEPEDGYDATYEPGTAHPMQGERIFADPTAGLVDATFDLGPYAGRQIRLRVDLGATRALQGEESWTVTAAALAFSTDEPAFDIPRTLALHPNYPDPFFESTTITYTLPEAMPVRLELYNMLGQRLAVLTDGEQEVGTHTLTMGRGGLASGVYLLRMVAGSTPFIERMIISR